MSTITWCKARHGDTPRWQTLRKLHLGVDEEALNRMIQLGKPDSYKVEDQLPTLLREGLSFFCFMQQSPAEMHSLEIHTGVDLKVRSSLTLPQASLLELTHHFGKAEQYYYKIARAEDDRPVEANRVRKSIGAETSFAQDLSDISPMLQELEQIAQSLRATVRATRNARPHINSESQVF